jgi:hypothetical protein
MSDEQKQLVQRKIRQLAFLHAHCVQSQYGKIPVDQNKEYQRLYADWQADLITLKEIEEDIAEYLKMRENV